MTTHKDLTSQERMLQVLAALVELPVDDWRTENIAAHAGVPHTRANKDLQMLAEHRWVRPTAAGWCPGHRFLGIAAKIHVLAS